MKIAEIAVDQEVGVIKGRKADYRELPRRAVVREIVTKQERVWSNSYVSDEPKFKNVRYVRVEWLDDPLEEYSGRYATMHHEPKGTSRDIEPQQVVGLWSALKGDVTKRIDAIREKKEGQAALEARLVAIFGKKTAENYISARYEGRGQSAEVTFYGQATDLLFNALERP